MQLLIAIFKASTLFKLAVLGVLVGIGYLVYGHLVGPPARASLVTLEGTITEAVRATRTNRRTNTTTVTFQLTLRPNTPPGASETRLSIPSNEIGETQVRGLIGRVVRAEFDAENDVYVLASGGTEILTYQGTLERRNLSRRQYQVDGIAILGGSSLVLLISGFLAWRKLRRAAVAPPTA